MGTSFDESIGSRETATYSAAFTNIIAAAATTDIFTITGSATKDIILRRILISGTQTSIGNQNLLLIKRSSANTGGTFTSGTAVPWDSEDPAASATTKAYTVNPTALGTAIGTVLSDKILVSPTTGGTTNAETAAYEFGDDGNQNIILSGTSETLAVNLNGQTIIGGSFSCTFIWTEE